MSFNREESSGRIRRTSKGFTLLELITTVAIIAIGAGAIIAPITAMIETIIWDRVRNELVDSAQVAMRRMALEIQNVRDEQAIIVAGANDFQYLNVAGEFRRFRIVPDTQSLSGYTLRVTLGTPELPLSEFVDEATDITFTYFNQFGEPFTTMPVSATLRPAIRSIRVAVNFNSPYLNAPFYLVTEIRPGNLSDDEDFAG